MIGNYFNQHINVLTDWKLVWQRWRDGYHRRPDSGHISIRYQHRSVEPVLAAVLPIPNQNLIDCNHTTWLDRQRRWTHISAGMANCIQEAVVAVARGARVCRCRWVTTGIATAHSWRENEGQASWTDSSAFIIQPHFGQIQPIVCDSDFNRCYTRFWNGMWIKSIERMEKINWVNKLLFLKILVVRSILIFFWANETYLLQMAAASDPTALKIE